MVALLITRPSTERKNPQLLPPPFGSGGWRAKKKPKVVIVTPAAKKERVDGDLEIRMFYFFAPSRVDI